MSINEHKHLWKEKYRSKIPFVRIPYIFMECDCGEQYPAPIEEGF